MKREDKEAVKWLLDAFMGEHIAACPHWDRLDKSKCPTYRKYTEAIDIVEKG